MNEFELPDDIKVLDKLYISPEDRIKELEEIVIKKQKRIDELQIQLFGHLKEKTNY